MDFSGEASWSYSSPLFSNGMLKASYRVLVQSGGALVEDSAGHFPFLFPFIVIGVCVPCLQ